MGVLSMNTHLVIGLGEVGLAVQHVLKQAYDVEGLDQDQEIDRLFDVLHICFPYGDVFVSSVLAYRERYLRNGGLVIIHSTTPLGITKQCADVHSPIRGVHPNLIAGIQTFVKYFGGDRADEAAEIFKQLNIKTKTTPLAETTEALKLWDTTYYGWNILFEKAVFVYCLEHGLDREIVYQDANITYNSGYRTLGREEVVRPVLTHKEGAIGGHCVIPNALLLQNNLAEFLVDQNRLLEKGEG